MEEGMSGFCMKAGTGGGGTKCGRWNPTSEQVKVLTDLFRSGLRTPSTDQIQKISSQLSFYGKIESKNVFYWFQNHKARERQKRRKVSIDEKDAMIRPRLEKLSSPKHFLEVNQVNNDHHHQHQQHDRVIETLQLFPLNSFDESEEKVKIHANDHHQWKETTTRFSYTFDTEFDHSPLDLRLSFL